MSSPPTEIGRWPGRIARTRSNLSSLCPRIAAVEDDLAATLTDMASTASAPRAKRLQTVAAEARDFAVRERARAHEYE